MQVSSPHAALLTAALHRQCQPGTQDQQQGQAEGRHHQLADVEVVQLDED